MNYQFLQDASCSLVLAFGHFLWIGTLIALLVSAVARRQRTSADRYIVWLGGFAAMAISLPLTMIVLLSIPTSVTEADGTRVDPVQTPGAAQKSPVLEPAVEPSVPSSPNGTVRPSLPNDVRREEPPADAPAIRGRDVSEVDATSTESVRPEPVWWREYAPLVMSLYLLGVSLMGLRLVLGYWGGRRLRDESTLVTDVSILDALQRQADALGVTRFPTIGYCEKVLVPTVLGVLKPMILLPVSLSSGLTMEQIESVLAHELAHLRRYDHVVNLVQRVIESFLFFHPAIWWISRKIRDEREHCCDDLVVACGAVPLDYARSLLRVAELSRVNARDARRQKQRSFTAVSLLATGDRPSTLRQRIARLLGADHDLDVRPASPWFLGSIATVSLLAVWLLMTMTWTVLAEINRDRTQKTVIVTWSAIVDDSVMNEIRALNGLTTLATGSMETPDDGKFSTLQCSADELRTILKNHADNKRLVTLQNNIRHSLPTGGWRIGGEKRFFQMIDSEVIESTDVQNPGHFVNWYADGHETRDEDSDRARLIVDGKFRFTQTGFFSASVAKDVANGVSQWNGNHAESKATAKFDAVMTDGEATLVVLSPPAVTRQYQVLVEDGERTRFEAKTKQVPQLHAIFVHEAVRVPVKQLDQFQKLTRAKDWIRRGANETRDHMARLAEWQSRPSRSVFDADAAWTRELPSGGHVQLVGLGRPNEAQMIWWTPTGEPLLNVSDQAAQSLTGYELIAIVRLWETGASRVRGMPDGVRFYGGVIDMPDKFAVPGSQLLLVPVVIDKTTGKMTFKIGAGFGAWTAETKIGSVLDSVATLSGIEIKTQQAHEHNTFDPASIRSYPPKRVKQTTTAFRWKPTPDFEFTAQAITTSGRTIETLWNPMVYANEPPNTINGAAFFDHIVPQADIAHFVLKSRPVHWTEFTDFATEPAVALDPPLEFEGNRQGPRVGKHFAKLTDGIAVQLLGVGDLKTPKANWWKGDGQRLETAPVDRLPVGTGGTPEMRSRMRNFVYRVSGLSQGQAVKCYSSESPDHAPWEMLHVGNMRDNALVTNLVVPFSRLSPTDLCISVTQQEWLAPLSITPSLQITQREEADPLAKTLYGLVRVIGVSEEPGIPPAIAEEIDRGLTYPPQATLTVEWDLSLTRDLAQIEMSAVEKSGTRHQLHAWGRQRRTNNKTIEQPRFSCRLSDVDHFEIRLRPILHRVKFENVSLKRDENTDLKVTVASLPAAKPQDYVANFPDGASVELLAIESEQTTEKPKRWRPDGGVLSDKVEWPERVRFPNEASHDLLIRFQGLQKGQLVVWRLKGLVLGPNRPEDDAGAVRVRVNNTGDATELRVGLTETEWGPWQKVDVSGKLIDPVEVPPAHRDSYRQLQPDHVTPLTGHTRLDWRNVPAISDQAVTHVVAIDKQGKRHEPSAVTLWGDQNPQHADVFKLAVEDIDHFEYQHLPFRHWATWKNISLRAGHRTKVEVEKNSIRSTAILPGGISVEFVGLAEMGKEDKTWWKPDGDVLIPSPKLAPQHRGTWKIGAEELRRTLFHVRGLKDSRALSSNMSGSIDEEQLPGGEKLHSWSGALQKRPDQKTAVARIGVATEPISPTRVLDANGQRRPKPANAPIDHIAEDITVTKVKSLEGGHNEVAGKFVPITQTELSFETPMAWRKVDLRIVAIDKEGKTHHQSGSGGNLLADANSKTQGTMKGMVMFPLPPEQIDRFEYQFRLYRHWVTFENVAWQSGETTRLKITTDSLPSSKPQQYVASLPDGRSVELVGITKNTTPAKDGWKPDGTSIGDVGYWPATIVLHSANSSSFASSTFEENGPHPEPDAEAIDVLFRFQGLKEKPSITFDMATNGTSYSHLPLKHPYDLRISTRRRGDPHPGSQWGIPDGEVRVGLTDEPWGKWVQISPEGKVLNPLTDEDLHRSNYEKVQIVGVAPHERAPNKQALVLRQPQDASRLYSFEIRGVDEDGKAQWVLEWDGRGIEGTEIKEGRWGLANNEKKPLARYEFRLRPYRYWATFKGVSFQPGKTSDVKVSVEMIGTPVASAAKVIRPSAADLAMSHAGPFRPDEISPSPDTAKSDQYLSPFAAHLSEQTRRDAGQRFDEAMKAIDRSSPERFEASINRIIQTTADLPAIYRAALMFNLMMASHEWLGIEQARQVGFEGTLFERVKHHCAMSGLADVDAIPIGLALRFLEFGTEAQLASNTDNDPNWPEQRRRKAMLWLTQIDKVRRVIDPLWEEKDVPQLSIDAPEGLPSGVAAEAVRDPKLRADYEQRIKANRLKAERYAQQLQARRLLADLSPRIEENLIRLYARQPLNVVQIETLLEQHSTDRLADRVAKTVRWINGILPNGSHLKYGWPDALAAAGTSAVPQLIAAVKDKTYPQFIRLDGAWALGLIGDPRALPVLTEVAEDEDTPDKYKAIAREFMRAINAAKPAVDAADAKDGRQVFQVDAPVSRVPVAAATESDRDTLQRLVRGGKIDTKTLQELGARVAQAGAKDAEFARLVMAEFEKSCVENPNQTRLNRDLLTVMARMFEAWSEPRWRAQLDRALAKKSNDAVGAKQTQFEVLSKVETELLKSLIRHAYNSDRGNIAGFTLAVRQLHHPASREFLRDVLTSPDNNPSDPFSATPAVPQAQPEAAKSKWKDNIGGGWGDAKFVAAIGLAELNDTEGVEWLLSKARDNEFGIDDSLFQHRHVNDRRGSLRDSSRRGLADLFGLRGAPTFEELTKTWHDQKSTFVARPVALMLSLNQPQQVVAVAEPGGGTNDDDNSNRDQQATASSDGSRQAATEFAQPKNKEGQSLFKKWQVAARANGDIPGGTLGPLVRVMQNFVKNNPTHEASPKLVELLKRVDVTRDWSRDEAVKLVDEVAEIYPTLPDWVQSESRFTLGDTVVVGRKLPAELKDAPWGEAQPNGLRVAWLLEPRGSEHRLNTPLKSRIVFHNSGKNAVVFRTLTWNQSSEHKARDASGKEINIDSTYWTTIPSTIPCRLAPGESYEVIGAGIGVGANNDDEDWRDARLDFRVGAWIAAKVGDEVTFSPAAIDCDGRDGPHLEGSEDEPNGGPKAWWLKFIKNRLSLDAPLPADQDERGRLLDRAVRDLFGTAPTEAELTAFKNDATPTALDSLAKRLSERAGCESFSGMLTSGSTKFTVLPVDPEAAKRPRSAKGPGRYPLGGNVTFVVTRRPIGERIVNEAHLSFSPTDATKPSPREPYEIKLPDGYDTWAAAWERGGTVLWVMQKGHIQRFDFTDREQVQETPFAESDFDKVPDPIRAAFRRQLDVPQAPKQQQKSQ